MFAIRGLALSFTRPMPAVRGISPLTALFHQKVDVKNPPKYSQVTELLVKLEPHKFSEALNVISRHFFQSKNCILDGQEVFNQLSLLDRYQIYFYVKNL